MGWDGGEVHGVRRHSNYLFMGMSDWQVLCRIFCAHLIIFVFWMGMRFSESISHEPTPTLV